MPFMMAPMPCSRTPKWTFRPAGVFAVNTPASFMYVLVEGFRSADPPTIQGTFLAMALSTCPELSRVAIPFGSAWNTGMSLSHPAGSSRASIATSSAASLGNFAVYSANSFVHAARAAAPRLPIPSLNRSYTPSGTRNEESSGQP